VSARWEVLAGCEIVVVTPPSVGANRMRRRFFKKFPAVSRLPFNSKETMPPPIPRIVLRMISCCGGASRPGEETVFTAGYPFKYFAPAIALEHVRSIPNADG